MQCERCKEPITNTNHVQIREKHWHNVCFTQERSPEVLQMCPKALLIQTIRSDESSLMWVPYRDEFAR